MKIAICGTHGTGKTTLARALSERLGVPMIEEVARKVIKRAGFQSTKEYIEKATKEQIEIIQQRILWNQISGEISIAGHPDNKLAKKNNFVSDRSVFDALAYTRAYGVTGLVLNAMTGEAVRHALNTYDLLVYVPMMFDAEDDGFRDMDEGLRWDVDRYMRKYVDAYEALGGKVCKVESEQLDERIEEVVTALSEVEHGVL